MQSLTRSAARAVRRTKNTSPLRQQRLASNQSYQPQTPAKAPSNESFGPGFFIGILCIPAAFAVYSFSRPGKDGQEPYFSRLITNAYTYYAKENEERNALHTEFIEQAAADRLLFTNGDVRTARHIDLRFPEKLVGGSPFNQAAGHSHANVDAMLEKYQKEAFEANERKLQQIRDNNVPAEKPFKSPFTKVTPGAADS